MKRFLVCSAIFTAMFLMISCGGSENGCKDLYNCMKNCESERCEDECYEGTTNAEQEDYRKLRNCIYDWEDGYGEGMSQKQFCKSEYAACGM